MTWQRGLEKSEPQLGPKLPHELLDRLVRYHERVLNAGQDAAYQRIRSTSLAQKRND